MERHIGDPLMGKLHQPRGTAFLYRASENCGGVRYLDKIWTTHVFLPEVDLYKCKVLCFHKMLAFSVCFQSQIVTSHQIFFIHFEFWGRWHRAVVRRVGLVSIASVPNLSAVLPGTR